VTLFSNLLGSVWNPVLQITFLTVFVSSVASASNIVPSSAHSAEIGIVASSTAGSADLVHVRAANGSGISFNSFDAFTISDRPLKLVNVIRQSDPTLESEARLIVVLADTISIHNEIEIVGPASDILFLSTSSSGGITCSNCAFKNVHRITLASANPKVAFNDAMSAIGTLRSSNAAVSVNNLFAPGALSLELLANVVSMQGEVSLHQSASKDFFGGYSQALNGAFTIGTGSVNVLIGDMDWDYESQFMQKLYPRSENRTIGGTIKALAVKMTSSESVSISSTILTHADMVSTIRYRGQTHVSDEFITLQSLGGGLTLSGTFESSGNLVFNANGNLTLEKQLIAASDDQSFIAKDTILNKADISGDRIDMAGGNVINRGRIQSLENTYIFAEKNIANEYGGVIIGEDVNLQAKLGTVRNGSRFPYLTQPADSETVDLFDLDIADLTPTSSTHLGTFYNEGLDVSTNQAREAAPASYAHILGTRVEIKAAAFENINPYWARIDKGAKTVVLNRNHINQVTVSGEESLLIDAKNYVLNTSAIIRLNSEAGLLGISTGILTNERYRTLNLLDKVTQSGSTQQSTTYVTRAHTYSPAGIIVSMGDLELDASVGFLNNTAYLEVFGDAKFKTGTINDIGLAQGGVGETSTFVCTINNRLRFEPMEFCRFNTATTVEVPKELDSMFFVHGYVAGEQAAFASYNYNPLDTYKEMAAENVIQRELISQYGEEGSTLKNGYLKQNTYNYDIQGNVGDDLQAIEWSHSNEYLRSDRGGINIGGTLLYSLLDELALIYESLAQYFSDLFAEIDWWD
jgi:hypothetical protein